VQLKLGNRNSNQAMAGKWKSFPSMSLLCILSQLAMVFTFQPLALTHRHSTRSGATDTDRATDIDAKYWDTSLRYTTEQTKFSFGVCLALYAFRFRFLGRLQFCCWRCSPSPPHSLFSQPETPFPFPISQRRRQFGEFFT